MKQRGGLLAAADLAAHRSDWIDPISTTYRGYEVLELPPNTQGVVALEMLNILEGFDLKALGHNSAAYLHPLVEAKRIAFADRAAWLADGDCRAARPCSSRCDRRSTPPRGARRSIRTAPRRTTRARARGHGAAAGAARTQSGDTIYLTAADRDGNVVSLIQSIYESSARGSSPAIPASRSTTAAACSR